MKLSACVIVKDRHPLLERCLSSIREYVDEIIITDFSEGGGHTAVEQAERYGAVIQRRAWTGDAAEARNESMDSASGDWLLLLCADEFLRSGDGPRLRAECESASQTGGGAALQMELIYLPGGGETERTLGINIRLLRREAGLRFLKPVFESPVQPETGLPSNAPVAPLIALCRSELSESAALTDCTARRVTEYPEHPTAYLLRGFQYKRVGRPLKTLHDFERAVDLRYRVTPDGAVGLPPMDGCYPSALYDCGVTWAALGDYQRAVDRLVSALKAQSLTGSAGFDYHDALRKLVSYTKTLPDKNSIAVLSPFATDTNSLTRMVNILRSERMDGVFLHFCELWYNRTRQRDINYIAVQVVTGEYAAAVSALLSRYRSGKQDIYAYRALVVALLANKPGMVDSIGHEAVSALLRAYAGYGPVEPYIGAYIETADLLMRLNPDAPAAARWVDMVMDNPELAERMGDTLSLRDRDRRAIRCFKHARMLYGGPRPELLVKLAFCSYRAGLYGDVAEYAESALKHGADMRRLELAVFYAAGALEDSPLKKRLTKLLERV